MLLRNLVLSAFSLIKTHYSSGVDVKPPSSSSSYPANPPHNATSRPHATSFSSHNQANKFMASQQAIYGHPVANKHTGHNFAGATSITINSSFSKASTLTNGANSFSANEFPLGDSITGRRYPGASQPDITEFGLPAGLRKKHSAGNLGSYVVLDDGSHQFLKGGGYVPGSS